MATYSEVKAGLDEISSKQQGAFTYFHSEGEFNKRRRVCLLNRVTFSFLRRYLSNEAFKTAWSEKNELVKDFQALSTYINALLNAINQVAE